MEPKRIAEEHIFLINCFFFFLKKEPQGSLYSWRFIRQPMEPKRFLRNLHSFHLHFLLTPKYCLCPRMFRFFRALRGNLSVLPLSIWRLSEEPSLRSNIRLAKITFHIKMKIYFSTWSQSLTFFPNFQSRPMCFMTTLSLDVHIMIKGWEINSLANMKALPM